MRNKPIKTNLDEVAYFQAANSYSIIVWANGNTLVKSRPMKKYVPNLLANGWCRIHRSFTVNPNYVSQISDDREYVHLTNGKQLPISRRLKANVLHWRNGKIS